MDDVKHTPGPWGIELRNSETSYWWRVATEENIRMDQLEGGYEESVAETDGYDIDSDALVVAKANAQLIAASPGLLKACKNAAKALDRWQDNTPHEQAAIDQLRAVILKAKG